jgi:Mg2+-importing ATPase
MHPPRRGLLRRDLVVTVFEDFRRHFAFIEPFWVARHLASGPIPESLGKQCLDVAAMDDQEIWRAFDSHPD